MALNATNVANALIDTLNKLSNVQLRTVEAISLRLLKIAFAFAVMSREAGVVVQNLQNLCVILADAAEAAAEAPGTSPLVREDYANFANEARLFAIITAERMVLDDLRVAIGGTQATPALQKRLVESAKKIAHLTSEMILLTEGTNVRRIVEEAKTLARWARAVIVAVNEPYESFMSNCQSYGQASVQLARSLKEWLAELKDAHHKAQVSRAYDDLREICPRLVQTAAKCFDAPNNPQLNEDLQNAGKELAGKIAYAISVAHPPNVSTGMAPAVRGAQSQAPTSTPIPITLAPEEQPQGDKPRKKTVREAGHGTDILNRVRTATISADIHQQMGEAISKTKGMAKQFEAAASAVTSPAPRPTSPAPTAPAAAAPASKPAPKMSIAGNRGAASTVVGAPNISPLRTTSSGPAPSPPSPRSDSLAAPPPAMMAPPPPVPAPSAPDQSPELLQRIAALEVELHHSREANSRLTIELEETRRQLQVVKVEFDSVVQFVMNSSAKIKV